MSDVARTSWTAPTDPSRSARLRAYFAALTQVLVWGIGPFGQAWVLRVGQYVTGVRRRLEGLLDRIERGTPWRVRKAARRVVAAEDVAAGDEGAAARSGPFRLTGSRGWLRRRYGLHLNITLGELERMLAEPAVLALLAREPARARRVLGRFAHMMAIDLPLELRAPARRRARTPRAPRRTAAAMREALWYRNGEGRPIDLWGESRRIERAARKGGAG